MVVTANETQRGDRVSLVFAFTRKYFYCQKLASTKRKGAWRRSIGWAGGDGGGSGDGDGGSDGDNGGGGGDGDDGGGDDGDGDGNRPQYGSQCPGSVLALPL